MGKEEGEQQSLVSLWQTLEKGDELFVNKAAKVVMAIAELKRDKKVVQIDYMQDERFLKVMKALESDKINKLEPLAVVKSLKCLEELGVSGESFCVKNLENTLVWSSRTCSIRDLIMLLSFSMARRKTESQGNLLGEICKTLERRWMEIKEGWQFAGLLHYSGQFSPQFLAKLEDRIADLVEEMTAADLSQILTELGRKKRRNVVLIKAITFYLTKHRNLLDIKQLSDSLFALNVLSFKDQTILDRLCEEIETKIAGTENPAVLRSILTSLGQLRFPCRGVVDRVLDWYQERLHLLGSRDMASILVTLANLNHVPSENNDKLMTHLSSSMSPELFEDFPRKEIVWLDVVWSLVSLGRVSDKQLESVLCSDFQNNLLYSDNKNLGGMLKLLNVNAAATKIYKNYKGPTINISEDALLRDIKPLPSLPKVQFCQAVMEAFVSLFPPPRFILTDVNTMMGCVVDGEFVCEATTVKPLVIQELTDNFGFIEPIKPLPPGACKVALVVASFHDCLIGGELSGVTAFHVKLIEAAGYKVLLVKYTDIQQNQTMVARVKKLDSMLRNLLEINKKQET